MADTMVSLSRSSSHSGVPFGWLSPFLISSAIIIVYTSAYMTWVEVYLGRLIILLQANDQKS